MERALDDSATITENQIENIVRTLCISYANIRRSFLVNKSEINRLYEAGQVTKVVSTMAKVYQLPKKFLRRVGYDAKIRAPAALHIRFCPVTQRPLRSDMFFNETKAELLNIPQYRLLHMIGHELAHAIMYSDDHELAHSEFATDILALLVTGNSQGYKEAMCSPGIRYGYIRKELLGEVFRCLDIYSDTIYSE